MTFRRQWPMRAVLLALALLCAAPAAAQPAKLPALGADPARISASGLSSGGFMALQYAVAFSASVMGVGVVAGGPYNCAYVTLGGTTACQVGAPLGGASYDAALGFAGLGEIDPVDRLKSEKVYLFSGTKDKTVKRTVVDAVRDFFGAVGTPAQNIEYVRQVPAGHGFISVNFGAACGTSAPPYVNECLVDGAPYDQPEAILTQIYGTLRPKAARLSAAPTPFDQTEFAAPLAGMAKTGYAYIPASCTAAGARCAVHVVFHGCKQAAGAVGDAVYQRLGYNAWADANGIIVLYPQVVASTIPVDPDGCWDWWGYSGLDFQTRSGPQLAAVHAMVLRLLGRRQ
ncbi:MAG TPA: PHB depolymerase family esterase [Stellaceae bacterium]|nr:PHB depolymerase family esterase [Stellaceae bacterium]